MWLRSTRSCSHWIKSGRASSPRRRNWRSNRACISVSSGGPIRARTTVGLSTLAELLRAVTGLSATPAGIGALVALLGAFLLVGSGAAASTIP